MSSRRWLAAALVCFSGCAQLHEADENMELARTKGKFHVQLTENPEEVEGTCKFVRMISTDIDPVKPPTKAELPDWFRTYGAYFGADTVLVRGKAGDAYICGKGPLNPDGTRQGDFPPPAPVPTPTPTKH